MITETDFYFDLDDFAEYVTVKGKRMKAIFDRVITEINEGQIIVKGYKPTITCQTTDFDKSKAGQGDIVVVRKKQYEITDVEPDGTGITSVTLFEKL